MDMLRDSMRYGAALCALVFVLATPTDAATPASGTLSPGQRTLTYTFPFSATANASGAPEVGGDVYTCNTGPTDPCDVFTLTLQLPADFRTTNPNDFLRINAGVTSEASDIDLQLADAGGANLVSYRDNPPAQPFIEYASLQNGTTTYQIQVVPGTPHEGGSVTVELVEGPPPPPPDADGDGVADADDECPGTPAGTSVDATGCEISAPPAPQCTVPGPELIADADGDNIDPADDQAFDIRALNVAEQNFTSGKEIVFTLKVDSLAAWPQASSRWIIPFQGANNNYFYVRMTKFADGGAPVFEYGSTDAAGNPGCFQATGPLDSKSRFATDGTITLVVDAEKVGGLAAGQELKAIRARAQGLQGSSVVCGSPVDWDTTSSAAFTSSPTCPVIVEPPQQQPTGTAPRFYDFQSPTGLGDAAGEPTLGYNPATKNAMFIAGLEVDRVTFAENAWAPPLAIVDAAGDPLPEACEPEWQDKSYAGAVNTLDPILETEQISGRTFQSSLSGANSIFAFSDDDGDSWVPAQAGPPNGGVDHQTVGVGPWAAGAKPPTATEDYAVYYCSQSVAAAFCSRSDNGGVSFGPGIDFRDTLTDCDNTVGGLHGHVQVARNDGTVYVPFGNCGTKVGVAVSNDSGITWEVNTIPQSAAGDDPGLGIADDGTAYMCYSEGTSGPYASTSTDKGRSWSGKYNLGAAHGIKHAVFVTAVAGDRDRAACAFIGTQDEDGGKSPEAEDFKGVWYPYISVTYDGGQSWHTVNVAPNDPVQGWGGICLSGTTCGGNRNLLDFNDIVIDDQGRILFGYADGCRGACVLDPTKNTFSDNGVIARQSGGRTLRAAFDDTGLFNSAAAVKPGAACALAAQSRRTTFQTRVAWKTPDTGGSDVTNYKVYRATTATGPFTFVADAGQKNYLIDPTAESTEPVYYYRVVAENAQGAAPASNVIELPITVPVDETSCTLPGVTVASEANAGDCTGTGGGCTPQTDVQSVHVAELQSTPALIVITVKAASLVPAPAPDTYWYVLSKKQDGSNLYVGMDTASGTPRFTYGTYEVGTVTTFTEQGTLDASSSYEDTGAIHLVAPRTLFGGLAAGDIIPSIEVRTRAGVSAAPSRDVVGPGDYTVRGTQICLANTPPVAQLRATPQFGGTPLEVTFDGTDSYDNDVDVPDSIALWTINFGDGTGATAEAQRGETPVWTHTYAAPGLYSAKLRVTDSRGLQSENPAEKVISIEVPGVGSPADAGVSNNRLGGALSTGALLVLGLLGALRRPRKPASR
jgi:hypothetical protein